jgi:hypothetical protein
MIVCVMCTCIGKVGHTRSLLQPVERGDCGMGIEHGHARRGQTSNLVGYTLDEHQRFACVVSEREANGSLCVCVCVCVCLWVCVVVWVS